MFIFRLLLKFGKYIIIGIATFIFFCGLYYSVIGFIEIGKTNQSSVLKIISKISLVIYFLHLLGIVYLMKYYYNYNFIRTLIYSSFIHVIELMSLTSLYRVIKNLDFTIVEIPLEKIFPYLNNVLLNVRNSP